jgi:hypothetical protein
LQAETINILKDAQKAVETSEVVSRYTIQPEKVDHYSHDRFQASATSSESFAFQSCKSFVVLPPPSTEPSQNMFYGPDISSSPSPTISSEPNVTAHQTTSLAATNVKGISARRMKPTPSVESFKSALSFQETNNDIVNKIDAVQGILHAFKIALETLENLVQKRIKEKDEELWYAARTLKGSLIDGEEQIGSVHKMHYKDNGESYIKSFTGHREFSRTGQGTYSYSYR